MFQEIEYKYKADNIGYSDFQKVMEKLDIVKRLEVGSWDTYYTKGSDEFLRFRDGPTPELTKKTKVQEGNNWVRVECDLPLDPTRVTEATVTKFAEMVGYTYNFKINKSCFIYWTKEVNYVFYIVYDMNMKELGRFIEVEINKELADENSTSVLNEAADKLKEVGLTPQNRMKKSLFEMFKK